MRLAEIAECYPPSKGQMQETFDYKQWASEKPQRVAAALADLRASAAAPYMKVFGSSISGKANPTDIDVFVDLNDVPPGIKVAEAVMEIARKHFGLVDPFLLNRQGKLFCHSEASRPEQMGWTFAVKHVRTIIRAGKAGTPLRDFRHPMEPSEPVTEAVEGPSLQYDQRNGIGAVPDNNNVDYMGLRVLMRPSQFRRLAAQRDFGQSSNLEAIMQQIAAGNPIGSPFLEVNFGEGDGQTIPQVRSHEGRTRMEAIRRVYGDVPVEVHIFPTGGLRARHIRPAAAERFREIAYPEKLAVTLDGPHYDKLLSKLSLHESSDASQETVTLLDLYDERDLMDEREHLANRIGREDHEKPLPVRTMTFEDAKKLRVLMKDMTVYEAFAQFASREQKRIVREKMRNFDHDRIIVIENDAVVDGNHHVVAAIKAKQPIRYVNLADLG